MTFPRASGHSAARSTGATSSSRRASSDCWRGSRSSLAGGCALEAAEAVCDATLDGLEALIDENLLRQEEQWGGQPRFSLLETIREYAAERLAELAEVEAARRSHAEHLLSWAEARHVARLKGRLIMQYQPEDAEYENVRAALMWAREAEEFELLLRLASAISPYWYARFNLSEGTGWLEDALARGSSQPAPIRARALAALAQLAWPRGDIERVRSSAEEARTIFAAEGDRDRLAHAVHLLSIAAELEGRYDDERRLQGEAEALFPWRKTCRG